MRQACVIIHGVGEQRPMSTLRKFVTAVLHGGPKEGARFWSKPDRMSESFELRRLSVPSTSRRPITDFYEYYWAYHMQDTKYRHVFEWFAQMLFRLPRQVPGRIKPLWIMTWLLILLGLLGLVVYSSAAVAGWQKILDLKKSSLIISALLFLVAYLCNWIALGYIGDAARYLNPSPKNIAMRQKIRSDGIQLVRRLHLSNQYQRIILVGHSLGSVIAYDIIRHLWPEFNIGHGKPRDFHQDALKGVELAGVALSEAEKPGQEEVAAFRQKQRELWQEQRRLGNAWLVTDMITLGSPLAYAELLLADSRPDLHQRQSERELPTCPPLEEERLYSYRLPPYEIEGGKRTIRVLNHGAPFACTRWTNFFFPGDIIGGPLNSRFGNGIEDVRIGSRSHRLAHFLPFTHTRYWKDLEAIGELVKALDLESDVWLAQAEPATLADQ